jgi:Flp pilus assembly protein TadG
MQAIIKTNFRLSARRGTTLVEMALALTLLMTLTLGVVEYGWLFLKQQQVTNAARQAARIASTADATNSTVNSEISTLMSSYGMGSTGYTTTLSPTDVSTAARGSSVSVEISVTYSRVTITNFRILPMPTNLSATVAMQKEGS